MGSEGSRGQSEGQGATLLALSGDAKELCATSTIHRDLIAEAEPEEVEEASQAQTSASTQIALPTTARAPRAVALLNQKHHVIGNYGNKCVILSWEQWEINRAVMVPTFQRFQDFRNRYMNKYVWKETNTGLGKVPAGTFWLSDPGRITYDSVAFKPNEAQVLPGNRLNLWRGFGVFPRKGSWKLTRNHIYRVLGAGDRKAGRYIIRWLAYMLQHPGEVGETVLVLQGHEGTGKGTLARAMLRIFGPHGLPVTQPKHLIGGFSGHLQHCCFLFLDEAFWAGDVQAEGRLKSLITEDTITIEPKYFTPFQVPNLLHIMMSSNNDWVVPAERAIERSKSPPPPAALPAPQHPASELKGNFPVRRRYGSEPLNGPQTRARPRSQPHPPNPPRSGPKLSPNGL